jgi:hypothetical protein
MAKTWILDSETKGTGAHVVPLQDAPAAPRGERELSLVTLLREPGPVKRAAKTEALRFKVVDAMSARMLAEDVDAREAVRALETLRSVLDARIFVWVPNSERWRLLGLEERKALWEFRAKSRDGHAEVVAEPASGR